MSASLYKAGFLLTHERDLEGRGIHEACLVGASPARLLEATTPGLRGLVLGLQEAQPLRNTRHMWQTRKEQESNDTSPHSSSFPRGPDPLVASLLP